MTRGLTDNWEGLHDVVVVHFRWNSVPGLINSKDGSA